MNEQLKKLLDEYPNATIVADVGASLFSGWGTLAKVVYHQDENVIELIFS